MSDKGDNPNPPTAYEIFLYREYRNEAVSAIECWVGESLAGVTDGNAIYSILWKPFGSPSFSEIYSWQGGTGAGENSFITAKRWLYEHNHESTASAQYYVRIIDSLTSDIYISNTVSFPRFAGFGKKTTRYSSNDSLKSQRKTRNKVPKF
jgi:hypothetical protein